MYEKAAQSTLFGGNNTVIGMKEIRRGGVKESKMMDYNNIIEALKKLQRSDNNSPLFITSAEGIMKCSAIIQVSYN